MAAASDPAPRSAAGAPDDPRVATGGPVDLLVAGDAVPDVIVGDVAGEIAFGQTETLVSRGALTVGGSSAIMACGAARLGLRVAFVGVFGDDAAGRFMLEELTARGVDVSVASCCRVGPPGSPCTSWPGRRPRPGDAHLARLRRRAHGGDGARRARAACAPPPRELVLPAAQLAPDLAGLFAEVRESGCTTSLDTQGDWEGRWQGGLREVLRETDLYLPNLDEARAVAASLGGEPAPASPGERSRPRRSRRVGPTRRAGPTSSACSRRLPRWGRDPS